jgi:hypothetical protein
MHTDFVGIAVPDYTVSVLEIVDIVVVVVVGTGAAADNRCRKTGSPPAAAIVDRSMQRYQGSGRVQGQSELRSRTGCCYQLGSRYTCSLIKIKLMLPHALDGVQ